MLYTISNDKLKVEISTSGAEIKKIEYLGVDYLHNSDPKYWCRSAPLLWPNIGAIKDKYSLFDGIEYPMVKHGIVRTREFKLVAQGWQELVFVMEDNEETRSIFPFKYRLEVTYCLNDDQIQSTIKVINKDEKIMPFNLGLHPAFKVPEREGEKFEDYEIEFGKAGSYNIPTIDLEKGTIDYTNILRKFENIKTLPLNYSDYDFDALVFENINFDFATLYNKDHSHGVRFNFPGFPLLGIWTPNNNVHAPFICIEPWIGCADSPQHNHVFREKRNIMELKPNEAKSFSYSYKFF